MRLFFGNFSLYQSKQICGVRRVRDKTMEQIKSKSRVANHGEVFTAQREVNAMLDLVLHETKRIDSRFLEPACGNGNFLVEILRRKLDIVEQVYKRNQIEYEHYAILAVSSIYGIDLMADNVCECRKRLYNIVNSAYSELYDEKCQSACRRCFEIILEKNIIQGDALSLQQSNGKPIIFSQWSFLNLTMLKRHDYYFSELMPSTKSNDALFNFFAKDNTPEKSDEGKPVFIPKSVRDYPPFPFLRIEQYVS